MREDINKLEVHVQDGGQLNVAFDNGMVYTAQNNGNESANIQPKVKSRTQEYAKKWNENMFLNDFDKRDENAGVNVKLSEVYLDEHLPHYIWGDNEKPRDDLKDLLSEYINDGNESKMLLILGQPGIGKSTLVTWITANFIEKINDILVYKFASDLKKVDWQDTSDKYDLVDDVLTKINLSYNDLEGKTVIIDGFDEIKVGNRIKILNKFYWQLIKSNALNNFSLIITCRENYIQYLYGIESDYITLQVWDKEQIQSFCEIYQKKTNIEISCNTVDNILKNKNILGIPLILYMVAGLDISIDKEGSIVDVYDKIFSLQDGGIYERCLQNKRYEGSHRISEIKEQIHQISREIAIWMFENNADEACIPREEYEKICINVIKENQHENVDIIQDSQIGNYFKTVKHCEGIETEKILFVHRTLYEYFVTEYLFMPVKEIIEKKNLRKLLQLI